MNDLWRLITNFGDSAVTVPLAMLAVGYLVVVCKRLRAGMALASVALGAGLTLLFLKLAFQACLNPLGHGLIHSPSGHAALSATIYGSLALLLSHGSKHRKLALTAVAVFVLAIAVSRLAVGAHNLAEMVTGLAIGGGFTLVFERKTRQEAPIKLYRRPLLIIAALTMLATYGIHIPAEEIIIDWSHDLQSRFASCE